MENVFANQYMALIPPDLLAWQKKEKVFPDQNDWEVVIRILKPSCDAHLRSYVTIGGIWMIALLVSTVAFFSGISFVSLLVISIIALMISALIDMFFSYQIINTQMCSIVLTSNRIIHWHHQGLFGRSSEVINFDNLSEVRHSSSGFLQAKVFRSGKLILKLISGKEQIFSYTRKPVQISALISHLQDIYKAGGKSFNFMSFLATQEKKIDAAIQSSIARNIAESQERLQSL